MSWSPVNNNRVKILMNDVHNRFKNQISDSNPLLNQKHSYVRIHIKNKVIFMFKSCVVHPLVLTYHVDHTYQVIEFHNGTSCTRYHISYVGHGIVSSGRGPHDHKPQYYVPWVRAAAKDTTITFQRKLDHHSFIQNIAF